MKLNGLTLLRLGFVLVFGWFGLTQLFNPGDWVGLMPAGVVSATHLSATTLVLINGGAEVLGALLLLLNWGTTVVAVLGALHLVSIISVVGWNAIGVRDAGLALALFAFALLSYERRLG